jgi:hypothetical protein
MRLLLSCSLFVCLCAAARADFVPALIPAPAEMRTAEGAPLRLDGVSLRIAAPSPEAAAALEARAREFLDPLLGKNAGWAVASETGPSFAFVLASAGEHTLEGLEEPPAPLQGEAYRLTVRSDGALAQAGSEPGLFYALTTLEQLFTQAHAEGLAELPSLDIADSPALPMRGYSEDYGRNQLPTLEEHKRCIRNLARFKMNTYLWFIEPDHFVYEFDPDLGKEYDRFNFDEIRELVAYAKQYHVQVIPTVELLGHMEMTLSNPKYAPLGELNAGGDLCPTCDDSFELVRKMVNEIAPAFDGPYFHCGLDETFSIGQGRSAEAVREKGLERVFADYYTRLNDLVKSHGKKMMMYADIALSRPAMLELLPKDIVMMFWDYTPRERYEGLDKLKAAGFEVVSLSGLWDWNNILPIGPPGFRNMEALAAQTAEVGGSGHFVSNWGDGYRGGSGFNLNEWNGLGVAYCGAVSWNPKPVALDAFTRAYGTQFYGTAEPALAEALARLHAAQGDTLAYVCRARFMFHSDPAVTLATMAEADEAALAFWRRLRDETEAAHKALARVKPARNADVLRAVDLGARMLRHAADYALFCREGALATATPDFDREALAKGLEQRAAESAGLWKEYQAIYTATNRPLNMKYLDSAQLWTQEKFAEAAAAVRGGTLPPTHEKELRLAFDFDGEGAEAWHASKPSAFVLAPVGSAPSPTIEKGGPGNTGQYVHIEPGQYREALDTDRRIDFRTGPFLVEAWVRHTGQTEKTYGSTILSFGEGGHGWRLGLDHTGKVLFTIYGVRDAVGTNSILPPDGQWHHVAVNFHGCRWVEYYIDGKHTDRVELEGAPDSPSTPLVRVGNEIGLVTPIAADIDRLRISAGLYTAEELDAKP